MNNRSRLSPEGSAKEQHLYGIKATERAEGEFKGGRRRKGRIFGIGLAAVLETTQTSASIKQAGREGLGFSSYKPDNQEIKYLVYPHYRTYSTYFCVKAVFTQRNSLTFLEHDVITKEAEAAVLLRTPLAGLVSGVEIKLW